MKPKRTKLQREADLVLITDWRLEGLSQTAIAARLAELPDRSYTLSQKTISTDLKTVQKRWEERQVGNLHALKMRELDKIEHMENKAWESYYRSIGTAKRAEVAKRPSGDYQKVTKTDLLGDPRWFLVILKCWERRARLLGLDAPEKHELGPNPSGEGLVVKIIRATPADVDDGDDSEG